MKPWGRRAVAGLALATVGAAGCGGGHHGARPTATPTPAERQAAPRLAAERPCSGIHGATCATLRVPLDPSGRVAGTLDLRVAMRGPAEAPVLVILTGGPGQPGVPFLRKMPARIGPVARRLRLVMLDQRGTGRGALRCRALQRAVGTSDVAVPPPAALRACAARIGPERRFYATSDTVADLEALRAALGADRMALDGTSYGTYVAERYALAHPDRVSRLVLDSVVAHDDLDPLYLTALRASARVLRLTCGPRCVFDPARDLAALVRARHDGPKLLDTLIALTIGRPLPQSVPLLLHAAREGRPQRLNRLVRAVTHGGERAPAFAFSSGLHAATLCADARGPWGGCDTPVGSRLRALAAAGRALKRSDVWPFDRATAVRQGLAQTCARWPRTAVAPPPRLGDLPPVPTLLIAGDRDLSTPLEWAREEAARAPRGRLLVVHGAGHSVQSQSRPEVRRALAAFLGALR